VRHVRRAEAQLLNLPDGGVLFVELEPSHGDERLADPFERLLHVQQADTGVHQGEAVLILEQQAVADGLRVRRHLQRPAVDVVDGRHRAGDRWIHCRHRGCSSCFPCGCSLARYLHQSSKLLRSCMFDRPPFFPSGLDERPVW
jgi:hypothetical protein